MRRINTLEDGVNTRLSAPTSPNKIEGMHNNGTHIYYASTQSSSPFPPAPGRGTIRSIDLAGEGYRAIVRLARLENPGLGNVKSVYVSGNQIFMLIDNTIAPSSNRGRVVIYDLDGVFQSDFFILPISPFGPARDFVLVGSNLFITIADQVSVYTTAGSFVMQFGLPGVGDGEFSDAIGISHFNGEIFVTDVFTDRVQVFDLSGVFQRKFTVVDGATYIDAESGDLYIASRSSQPMHVTKTDINGNVLETFEDNTVFGGGGITFNASNSLIYAALGSNEEHKIKVLDTSLNLVETLNPNYPQTEFFKYPTLITSVSLGTPDEGASVPVDNALQGSLPVNQLWFDMRTAIEALAFFYYDDGPEPLLMYNWQTGGLDPNNLYVVGMDDGTKYGATGGVMDDWRDLVLAGSVPTGILWGEMLETITTLQGATVI